MRTAIAVCFCLMSLTYALGQRRQQAWLIQTAWTTKSWTADPKPYLKVESSAYTYWKQTSSKDLNKRLAELRSVAKPKPLQAFERLFLEVVRLRKSNMYVPDQEFESSLVSAHKFGDYSSQRMARIRFIAQGRNYYGKDLEPLGDRLMAFDSKDIDVVRVQTAILLAEFSNDLYKQKKALSFAQRVYKESMGSAGSLGQLADAVYQVWKLERTPQNRSLAEKLLKQYLEHPDAKDFFKTSFRARLAEVQGG